MSIRILLVDDHVMMCEGLHALLSGKQDIEVVGQTSNAREALDLARTLKPDVVIIDVEMPSLNGAEATRLILAENPRIKVIALSTHTDKRFVQRMLAAGACSYVGKIDAHGELLQAVRAAILGKSQWIPLSGLERATDGSEVTAYSTLGAREREVLQLVAEGKSSAEAARAMHISLKTVETHRRNIVRKLGLHGTAELTKYAIREGLTSLDR
jgi:DNA-binding NarL/FixJ family response regulator